MSATRFEMAAREAYDTGHSSGLHDYRAGCGEQDALSDWLAGFGGDPGPYLRAAWKRGWVAGVAGKPERHLHSVCPMNE